MVSKSETRRLPNSAEASDRLGVMMVAGQESLTYECSTDDM